MSKPKEYEINTLDDILKIPHDRIDVMLGELIPRIKEFSLAKHLMLEGGLIPEDMDINEAFKLGTMTWVDDGKEDITTELTITWVDDGKEDITTELTIKSKGGE